MQSCVNRSGFWFDPFYEKIELNMGTLKRIPYGGRRFTFSLAGFKLCYQKVRIQESFERIASVQLVGENIVIEYVISDRFFCS